MKKTIKIISDFIFFSGLIFAGLVVVAHFTGKSIISPYIVSSGSMQPTINTGSIVFVLPAKDYYPNDVITFRLPDSPKTIVTHRLLFTEPSYITMGDANNDLDTWRLTPENIIGKVSFTLPYVGYIASFAKTPKGFMLLVIVPATIIIYEELKSLISEFTKLGKRLVKKGLGNKRGLLEKLRLNFKKKNPEPFIQSEKIAHDETSQSTTRSYLRPSVVLSFLFAFLVPLSFTASFYAEHQISVDNSFTAASPSPILTAPIRALTESVSEPQIVDTFLPKPTTTPIPTLEPSATPILTPTVTLIPDTLTP